MQNANLTRDTLLIYPQLKDNGVPANLTYVDTAAGGIGWSHLRVRILIGVTDIATTAAPKLTECDTTGGAYTDITSAALADAISATEDGGIFAIDVDLTKSHKRYIKLDITAGDGSTGTNLAALATLSRPTKTSGSAADAGLTELISA